MQSKETKRRTNSKTYKREVALALILGMAYVVTTGDVEMVKALIWPVFAFVMGAFGMDSYAKQVKDKSGSYDTDGDSGLR